jgi:hypothetical protein
MREQALRILSPVAHFGADQRLRHFIACGCLIDVSY